MWFMRGGVSIPRVHAELGVVNDDIGVTHVTHVGVFGAVERGVEPGRRLQAGGGTVLNIVISGSPLRARPRSWSNPRFQNDGVFWYVRTYHWASNATNLPPVRAEAAQIQL
jgi:hypothetical protein